MNMFNEIIKRLDNKKLTYALLYGIILCQCVTFICLFHGDIYNNADIFKLLVVSAGIITPTILFLLVIFFAQELIYNWFIDLDNNESEMFESAILKVCIWIIVTLFSVSMYKYFSQQSLDNIMLSIARPFIIGYVIHEVLYTLISKLQKMYIVQKLNKQHRF